MTLPLLPEDKLAILQATDSQRKWYSLDDQRVCVLCDRAITGRQIEVKRDGQGTYTVHCPTEGCTAVPSDWFYQGSCCTPRAGGRLRTQEAKLWE